MTKRMTPTIPRGTIIGKLASGPPLSTPNTFTNAKPAAAGLICAISVLCSTTKNRCRMPNRLLALTPMFSFMGSYLLGMPVVNLCFLLAAPRRPESEKTHNPYLRMSVLLKRRELISRQAFLPIAYNSTPVIF
jgi:hypothetical protein